MSKFDFASLVKNLKSQKKDGTQKFGLGSDLETLSNDPGDYVVLPDWFKNGSGLMGLPFGKWIQISGRPDSGKTSLAMEAIRAAQLQGHGVIYIETEGKTGPDRLEALGIDPSGVITIMSAITEEIYECASKATDAFFAAYPDKKLLIIIDSYGNTSSMRDANLDLTKNVAQVGGHAKINRLGIGIFKAKQISNPIAMLVINYSYGNIGSVGETNAGGRALEYACLLVIQATRMRNNYKTVKGVQVMNGVRVKWKFSKNQTFAIKEDGKTLQLLKELVLDINKKGIEQVTS